MQANYGARRDLRIDGVPVGQADIQRAPPTPAEPPANAGSIIVVIATDTPLLPIQCRRLARRATVGLARPAVWATTAAAANFLAFATGNHLPDRATTGAGDAAAELIDPMFVAVAEAVEEAIGNALVAAETMTGFRGRTVYALPHDELHA